ncbi:alanine--glyoxylate aminotransferase family protein [Corynebacterium sp. LK2510]|uniref:alanine--glyoxylate aminotransferase family protein n=1 Tax=Corynebacterium sp. LK2510 TaxID=3110472 RepID=UPI0034CF7007
MTKLPRPNIDPDGLLEYSVVFTDRSLNHMSQKFIDAAQEIVELLSSTYGAESAVLVPGGGTGAMEAVARQLFTGKRVLVLRSGLFTFRWSQIIETGAITEDVRVLNAAPATEGATPSFAPPSLDSVRAAAAEFNPDIIVTAHTETAAGLTLPEDYLRGLGEIADETDSLFVLDCIAAGAAFTDMRETGVDVLISAPQKSWSGSPSTGYVMLGEKGRAAVEASQSTSFTLDLKKWLEIFEGYRKGTAAYHSTLPTDTIVANLEAMREAVKIGLDELENRQQTLGRLVRDAAAERGYASVAADGYQSNGVVVLYAKTPEQQSGAAFKAQGLQIASGVPLKINEGESFSTFRIGLFGLDKWEDPEATAARFVEALDAIEA